MRARARAARRSPTTARASSSVALPKQKAFDAMNNMVAHALANLTAPVRFEGALNVDLTDLTSSLVPYPRLNFLLPALAPLYAVRHHHGQPLTTSSIITANP